MGERITTVEELEEVPAQANLSVLSSRFRTANEEAPTMNQALKLPGRLPGQFMRTCALRVSGWT
jgi:hypothetical protein